MRTSARKSAHSKRCPAELYNGSIFGWNAFRKGLKIRDIKYDTKKGYHEIIG
jgi:hypothetical protein